MQSVEDDPSALELSDSESLECCWGSLPRWLKVCDLGV